MGLREAAEQVVDIVSCRHDPVEVDPGHCLLCQVRTTLNLALSEPDPLAEAREILREVKSSGVSFEDERIKYKEVQLSRALLKDISDWLTRNGGGE